MANRPEYPFGFAQAAVSAGLSASGALRAYRDAGGHVRTQTWYRMWGEAQDARALTGSEADRPLNRRPTNDEIGQRTTVRARGFLQQVVVVQRDRETGVIVTKPYSLVTNRTVTRSRAIDTAISDYRGHADRYGFQVLGGYYAGTFELTPEDA